MSYLDDIEQKIEKDDYPGFLHLWEEYCGDEDFDGEELSQILELLSRSRFAGRFGPYAETALPLWERVEDPEQKHGVLRGIIDLQTSNTPELGEAVMHALKTRYGKDPNFNEKIRLVGLRNGSPFQGAIRNYELLSHLEPGKFVYHTGGWGTGEVMDVSLVREEIVLEFEAVAGRKGLAFENAFATLVAIDDGHFLAKRFGDADALEAEARKDPVGVIRLLLKDLGSKNASEIKDEMHDLVIPADDWTRWWQSARGKVKKDTHIQTPGSLREPFVLRREEVSHADRITEVLKHKEEVDDVVLTTYNFLRDFPEVLRETETHDYVRGRLLDLWARDDLTDAQRIEVAALIEEFLGEKPERPLAQLVKEVDELGTAIDQMTIAAFKKMALVAIREVREDWDRLFLDMLFLLPQSALREYMVKELSAQDGPRAALLERLEELLEVPIRGAHLFVWAFQRIVGKGGEVPMRTEGDIYRWFEGFLVLFHQLEHVPEYRDLVKRIYSVLTAKRYQLVRDTLKDSPVAFAREFLLLVSKCHTLGAHDQQILRSLVDVAHPQLAQVKAKEEAEDQVIWTTETGYHKVHQRIEQIGTVEMIANAREIERARELGDLRENAEFKAAQEKRRWLQKEMRMLSDQLNAARIMRREDVVTIKAGKGCIVELESHEGETLRYTLLGPWDADPDNNILSYQSRLAQAMHGHKKGDRFEYQGKSYTVKSIENYFDLQGAAS